MKTWGKHLKSEHQGGKVQESVTTGETMKKNLNTKEK